MGCSVRGFANGSRSELFSGWCSREQGEGACSVEQLAVVACASFILCAIQNIPLPQSRQQEWASSARCYQIKTWGNSSYCCFQVAWKLCTRIPSSWSYFALSEQYGHSLSRPPAASSGGSEAPSPAVFWVHLNEEISEYESLMPCCQVMVCRMHHPADSCRSKHMTEKQHNAASVVSR